jgi:hypothetical protein
MTDLINESVAQAVEMGRKELCARCDRTASGSVSRSTALPPHRDGTRELHTPVETFAPVSAAGRRVAPSQHSGRFGKCSNWQFELICF